MKNYLLIHKLLKKYSDRIHIQAKLGLKIRNKIIGIIYRYIFGLDINSISCIDKKLNIISDSTLDFATDKTLNSAYSMSDNYNTMKDDMKNLFDEVSGEKTQVASKVGLSEKNETKSLKDLDKLIERVILESMNKK